MSFVMASRILVGLMLSAAVAAYADEGRSNGGAGPAGKTIRSVSIRVKDVFDSPDLGWIYRTANDLKVNTKERVIRRELLFKEGDEYQQFVIDETVRRLRVLKYLREIAIVPRVEGDYVDLEVRVQDTWTLIPEFSASSAGGRQTRSIGLIESNILGLGNRLEASYSEDDERQIVETVFEDERILQSSYRFLGAFFDRSDGHEAVAYLGHPNRTLFDSNPWYMNVHLSDLVGVLYENGDEDYIYRQESGDFSLRYTFSFGDPQVRRQRLSLGYDYLENNFSQADAQDYEDLDLDPAEVDNELSGLPENRRYSGPVVAFHDTTPDYVSMNYIDRFERVEDYNLGLETSFSAQLAARSLGSREDAVPLTINLSRGCRFGRADFLRGEFGYAARYDRDGVENGLSHAELKYFNVLGDAYAGDLFLGKHTLAGALAADYGANLDRDRQLIVGADNFVRGYEARAFSGDKRVAFNLEDRIHLAENILEIIDIGAAAFFDAGGASYDGIGTLLQEQLYSDVGIGLRLAFPRSSGGRVARIDLAWPLRDGPDGTRSAELRFTFAGGQLFGARTRSESLGPEKANVQIGKTR